MRICRLLILPVALLTLAGCPQSEPEMRTFDESIDSVQSPSTDDSTPTGTHGGENADPVQANESSETTQQPASVATSGEKVPFATDRPPRVPLPEEIEFVTAEGEKLETASGPGLTIPGTDGETSEPREIKLLVTEKDFPRVPPDRVLRVSFDDLDLLKVLNMEPVPVDAGEYLPDWMRELDGERIRIRGFMLPPLRSTGLPGFKLARDNQICCFGRDPKVYDLIPVFLRDGTTTDYIANRPFDVVGTFYIRPSAYRDTLENLYEIEDAEIIER